jgi:hypothetical protein
MDLVISVCLTDGRVYLFLRARASGKRSCPERVVSVTGCLIFLPVVLCVNVHVIPCLRKIYALIEDVLLVRYFSCALQMLHTVIVVSSVPPLFKNSKYCQTPDFLFFPAISPLMLPIIQSESA